MLLTDTMRVDVNCGVKVCLQETNITHVHKMLHAAQKDCFHKLLKYGDG